MTIYKPLKTNCKLQGSYLIEYAFVEAMVQLHYP